MCVYVFVEQEEVSVVAAANDDEKWGNTIQPVSTVSVAAVDTTVETESSARLG